MQGFVGSVMANGNHNVMRVTQKGEVSTHCDGAPDGSLAMPNYGSFDSKGNYYYFDSGDCWKPNGRFVRVRPDQRSESLAGGNWHFPDGLATSPRDGAMFMIQSTAADVLRIPVKKDGTVGSTEIYAPLQGSAMDGLAFARNGNLYVSCYFPNRINRVFPDRNIELSIEDTTGEILNQPTSIAFESKGTRLFFANLGGQRVGTFDVHESGPL